MNLSRWTLPAPLPGATLLKPLSSARTGLTRLRNGELELTIKHEVIRGVSREMLAWWFCHIDGMMEYAGLSAFRNVSWLPLSSIELSKSPDTLLNALNSSALPGVASLRSHRVPRPYRRGGWLGECGHAAPHRRSVWP